MLKYCLKALEKIQTEHAAVFLQLHVFQVLLVHVRAKAAAHVYITTAHNTSATNCHTELVSRV